MTTSSVTLFRGIPKDHRVHESMDASVTVASARAWHMPESIFQPIWDMGITGKGVTIAINDTGVNPHAILPKPRESRNFSDSSGGGNIDRNGHGCIAPDDMIYTSNCGLQEIETFFDRMDGVAHFLEDGAIIKDVSRYNINTMSLDTTNETPQAVRRQVTHVHKIPFKGDLIKVAVAGAELSLTPWHPVYVLTSSRGKKKSIVQKRADELVLNDKICTIPKNDVNISDQELTIPVASKWRCDNCDRESYKAVKRCKTCYRNNSYSFSKMVQYTLDADLAFMAGLVISDGHLTITNKYVEFHSKDETLIGVFEALCVKLFDKSPMPRSVKNNCYRSKLAHQYAWKVFQNIGITKGNKSLTCDFPELIAKSPRHVIEAFIAGVIEGDGCVSDDRTKIITASDTFADKTVLLLRSLGVRASKSLCESDNDYGHSRTWHVRVGAWTSMENFLRVKKQRAKETYGRYCTQIIAICKEAYNGFMYDFTVHGSHNYVANGLVVSNTHCAGSALGRGGLGCAPEAELISTKVLNDSGSGATTWINNGRVWASQAGADIISESIGGPSGGRADTDSIDKAYESGVSLCVAAAGNSSYRGVNSIDYPGRYLSTCCVGSYNETGRISTYSSGGREIDMAAPGENILSANYRGGFNYQSGTSMATPHVAGLMALVMHKRRIIGLPRLRGIDEWRTWWEIAGFMEDMGDPGRDVRFGLGRPLILAMLKWLREPLNV